MNAQTTPIKIMPLGDSNTEGYPYMQGGYRPEFWNRMTADGFTVEMVGSQTDEFVWEQPHHEGHSGWTISDLDAQIVTWMLTYQPDMVLLMIGTNDAMFGEQDFMVDRMGALIDKIIATNPNVYILVAKILPINNPDPLYNTYVKAFNTALPDIIHARATLGYRVSLVDMNTPFSFSDLIDGVHPTPDAYTRMGDVWATAAAKVLRDPFQQLTPVAQQSINTPVYEFAWTQGTPEETYKLKIKSVDNGYVVTIANIPASACVNGICRWIPDLSLNLPPNHTYFRWRVLGGGRRTGWQPFYTDMPGAVTLLNPYDGKLITTLTPKFNWRYNPNAADYNLRVDWVIAADQKQRVIDLHFNATSTPTMGEICDLVTNKCQANLVDLGLSLPADGVYQWRVLTSNQYGKSKSAKATFTVNTTTLINGVMDGLIPLPPAAS